jgi:hypothetical protein
MNEIQELLLFSKRWLSSSIDLNQQLIQMRMNFIKQYIGFTTLGLIKIYSKTIDLVFDVIIFLFICHKLVIGLEYNVIVLNLVF